mmetsp:Transcript_25312/g.35348  ORF Transcript_25312/g.35348 Transcript_25312/m.35348 type:complete len:290 (+) Transcript_25312:45-914(+)
MGSVEEGLRKPLLNEDDTKSKSTACYTLFCNGFGTLPFYYGYAYGALTLLVLYVAASALSPSSEVVKAPPSTGYGAGVVRGGYRWPTAPMIEPISKTSFPFESKGLSTEAGMLLGVGIRLKKVVGVNFKVYAVGFYVNPAGARSALRAHQGESLESLRKNERFYSKLTNPSNFRKTLELRFLRSVGKEKLVDTFNEGLAVRMRKALGTQGVAIVKDFVQHFGDMKSGETLIFHIEKGALSIKVPNKSSVKFSSPELASSMLDLYFGLKPTVGEDLKKNLIERVPALWRK